MTVGREQSRALLSRIDQHPERREELRCHVLAQELLALPAVVAQQGDWLDRVGGSPARLRDALACRFARAPVRLPEATPRCRGAARCDVPRGGLPGRAYGVAGGANRIEQRMEQDDAQPAHLGEPAQRPERERQSLRSEVGWPMVTASGMVAADAADALVRAGEQNGFAVPAIARSLARDGEPGPIASAIDSDGERVWVLVEVQVQLRDSRTWLGRSPRQVSASDALVPLSSRRCSRRVWAAGVRGGRSGLSGWVSSRGAVSVSR
jgi:hypothetical protein